MDLYIGTSGWAYPEWKPAFYPADVPQRDFLAHYATRFTACEVNGTFYRLPSAATVANWADATPVGFRFAVKAPRAMVSGKVTWTSAALRTRDELMDALAPLGPRLAAVLLRYPNGVARDDERLATVLRAWDADAPPLVFDFRHTSWFHPDVVAAVAGHGHTIAVNDVEGTPLPGLPPGRIAHVRLRAAHYADDARRGWLDALRTEASRRPTFAFGRHEGIPAGDPHAGVGLAEWLSEHAVDGDV